MCGIAGLISTQKNSPVSLKNLSRALKHRGGDDEGCFVNEAKGVYLAHNRLSIIDLSAAAHQPLFNENKTVAALLNGEIYNFVDLRASLAKKGHKFSSHSDAEVIVHAYEEWGEDFVKHLRGMFAVALWDEKENTLILARDPIGIKPLYYLKDHERFIFASELQAFWSLGDDVFSPQINMEAARLLLLFPFIADDEATILQNVKKLPPAHILVFKNKQVTLKRYWQLAYNEEEAIHDFPAAAEVFEGKIQEVLALHLQSDVKMGVFLSGGVDSSFLASLAAKISDVPLSVFTAVFGHPLDEQILATSFAAQIKAEHIVLHVDMKDVARNLQSIILRFDDLSTIDGGLITLSLLAEKAKERGIKVMLNGEGADEIFCGYPWFSLAHFPYGVLPNFLKNRLWYYRFSKNVNTYRSEEGVKIFNSLINRNEKDMLRRISQFEIEHQLPNNFLMKVDKATMTHGVETRVPYLDKEIVQFAYNLPDHFKRNSHEDKVLLRSVAAKYLPHEIAYRRKRGFLFPFERFLDENRDQLKDYLFDPHAICSQLLTKKEIDGLLNFKIKLPFFFERQRQTLLWKLFILELLRGGVKASRT